MAMDFPIFELGELCDVSIGRTPPRNEFKWFNQDAQSFKWVSIRDMGNCDKYLYKTSETITVEGQREFNIPIVPCNTVILSFKLTIGRVAITGSENMLTNEAIAQLPIKNERVLNKEYLYYYLKNFNYDTLGNTSSIATAVNSKTIKKLPVVVPPYEKQLEIVSILSSLDDKIENNRRINDNLEQHAQALFENLIGNTNLEYSLIASLNHTIETGRRPKGGVANITNGIPSIGAENIKGLGKYDYSKTKYITADFAETMKKGVIKGYELLIYKDGGKPGYFIPNFSIFGEGYPYEDMTLNEHVFLLDFGNKGYNFFAYFFMQTEEVMKYLNAQGSKAAIPGINRNDVESISIPTIDNKEVKEFCSIVEPIITSILVNSKESSRLAFLRDTLLPKLMSGELGIDDISAD